MTISVSDYNNHSPEFEQTDYVYEVASPLMPKVDFTIYGISLKVTDLDFSNQDITFSINSDDFSVSTAVDSTNNKSYIAVFSTKSVLFLAETQEYVITARVSNINGICSLSHL